jgi:DNA-binding NarL/FixJ family response regulator
LEPVRILLIDLPLMLRDIIGSALRAEPDMVVVGELPDTAADLDDVDSRDARVLIFGARDGPARGVTALDLVEQRRDTVALAVSADGRRSVLYELRPCEVELGELSSERLVQTIREAVARADAGRKD